MLINITFNQAYFTAFYFSPATRNNKFNKKQVKICEKTTLKITYP